MADPVIKKVCPTAMLPDELGTADFTSLQAWEDWADGDPLGRGHAGYWAECYPTSDVLAAQSLGEIHIAGWTQSPTATDHPRIYAADGYRPPGTVGESDIIDPEAGPYIEITGYAEAIDVREPYVEIVALQIESPLSVPLGSPMIYVYAVTGIVIDSCVLHCMDFDEGGWGIGIRAALWLADGMHQSFTLRNTAIYGPNHEGTAVDRAIYIHAHGSGGGTATAEAVLHNNAVSRWNSTYYSGDSGLFLVTSQVDGTAVTLDVDLRNNIVAGCASGHCYVASEGAGTTLNITSQYNAASDTTLSGKLAGEGNHGSLSDMIIWIDPDRDLHLNESVSNLAWRCSEGGGVNLYAEFQTDLAGNRRPPGGSWDMGPLTTWTGPLAVDADEFIAARLRGNFSVSVRLEMEVHSCSRLLARAESMEVS